VNTGTLLMGCREDTFPYNSTVREAQQQEVQRDVGYRGVREGKPTKNPMVGVQGDCGKIKK
jgi:hypothetical protein